MFDYRIERQQDDGSWSAQEFRSVDDSDAITYGLSVRTANRCELYQAERWLATFDGAAEANDSSGPQADGNRNRSLVEMETEVAYFYRRALKEREWSRNGVSAAAKLVHRKTAENLESLARVVEAARRRRTFYDVNSFQGKNRSSCAGYLKVPCCNFCGWHFSPEVRPGVNP